MGEGAQQGSRWPGGGVGASVSDRLKAADPGGLPCRAGQDGVLEGLWGLVASGAGRGVAIDI